MLRILTLAALLLLAAGTAHSQEFPTPAAGGRAPESETAAARPDLEPGSPRACEEPLIASFSDDVLAVVLVDGPPWRTAVVQEVWNVGPPDLEVLIVDGFAARGGGGICIETVTPLAAPTSGRIDLHYPTVAARGMGPLVLGFDQLTTGACAGFCTGCGTYCRQGYAPTVSDLIGTAYKVVHSSDERGLGTLEACETYLARVPNSDPAICRPGSGIALVRRTYPR